MHSFPLLALQLYFFTYVLQTGLGAVVILSIGLTLLSAVVGVLRGLAALCSGPVRRASIVANNEDLDGFWEGLHHDPPSASLKRALL